MLINEFLSTHELHDSLLTNVTVKDDMLELTVDFCYWMQDGYREDDPETGALRLCFDETCEYNGPVGEIDDYSILKAEYVDGNFSLLLLDDFNDRSMVLSFRSRSDNVNIDC